LKGIKTYDSETGMIMERIEFSKRFAIQKEGKGVTILADGHPILTFNERELEGLREALGWFDEKTG